MRLGAVTAALLLSLALLSLALLGSVACTQQEPQRVRRITYWEKWTGFERDAMQAVVDLFNTRERQRAAQEPGYVPIEVEMVTVGGLDRKLLVAIAGGDPPDLAGAWTWLVYSYSEKGALQELTPYLAESTLGPEHYLPVFWDICQYRGACWALPTTPASTALHWNQRLLAEAGLDPERGPLDLQELEAMAAATTIWEVRLPDGTSERRRGWCKEVADADKRLLQAGFLPSEPNWWPWGWGFYFGGQLWNGEDAITATAAGNVAAFEWVQHWAELYGAEHLQRFQSGFGNFSSPTNPFMAGKVAMQIQGVWMANFIEAYAPGMQWRAAAFPHPVGRPDLAQCSNVEADVLVIPRDSAHPQEAWQFMQFVASPKGMELLCLGQRKFSPLRQVSDEFWQQHPHPQIELFRRLAEHANGFSTPKLGIWNEYRRELEVAFGDVLAGRATPEAALAAVQARIQASLERNRRITAVRAQR